MEKFKGLVQSGLFFFLFLSGIVFFGMAIVLAVPLTSLATRRALACSWSRFNARILRLTCGLKVRVLGQEHLPDPPFVLLCNHQSAWETVSLHHLFPLFVLVLKKSLMRIPIFGWALWATGQIAIDRGQGVEALRTLRRQGKQQFDQGTSVLIFPEGTRKPLGALGRFNAGGVDLALNAGVPIVPIAHNAGRFWGRRSFIKKPGEIQLRIAPAIITTGCSSKDRRELLQQVRSAIETLVGAMDASPSIGAIGQADELHDG